MSETNNKKKKLDLAERVDKALEDTEIPKLHFNGFVNTMAIGDVLMVLEKNGKPVATLNGSYTVVKSFANSLNNLIENLERKSERKIMTTKEVETYMSEDKKNEH